MSLEYDVKSEYFFPLFADKLFGGLTPKSRKSLDKIKQTRQFQKGAHLFAAGDMPCRVYILQKGRARLLFNDELKDIHIAHPIVPNEIFGLTEMIVNLPYETDAETITVCTCECIESEDFIRFLHNDPQVCFRLLQLLAANIKKADNSFFIN